jgi:hypothetical protein
MKKKIRLLLMFFGFFTVRIHADEIPTLDLSGGHSYSLIAKGGISLTAPRPKINQFILDTNLQIKLGQDRTFTITSTHKPFGVVSSDYTNIVFVSLFGVGFQNVEQAKEKLQQLRATFRWDADDFTNWPHLEMGNRMNWFKINESELPFYMVKITSFGKLPGLPMPLYPYSMELIIGWDTNSLERLSVEIGMIRRRSELEKAVALAASQPPIIIPKAPEDIVKLYLDLLNRKNFMQAARLLDSEGIKNFRQTLSYFDHGSGSEFVDGERELHFGENATRESIAKLSDEEFIGKWMEGRAFIAAILLDADQNAWSNVEIISSIPEGTTKLHVSVRMDRKSNLPPIGFSDFPVISLSKQQDGSWKIEMSQDILNAAKSDAERIEEK